MTRNESFLLLVLRGGMAPMNLLNPILSLINCFKYLENYQQVWNSKFYINCRMGIKRNQNKLYQLQPAWIIYKDSRWAAVITWVFGPGKFWLQTLKCIGMINFQFQLNVVAEHHQGGELAWLTSDDVNRHVGRGPHRGAAGVLAAVREGGLADQQGGARVRPSLGHLTHPASLRALGDWLERNY